MNYSDIKQLSAETGIGSSELIALSAANDPFYAGVPSREIWARWFADIWNSFGWTTGLHLRRIHYVLVSQESPVLKPDGEPYENTENDWKSLGRASLGARYLRLMPSDGLVDRRNPEPIINAANGIIAGAIPSVGLFGSYPRFDYKLPDDLNLDDTLFAPALGLLGEGETLANGQPYLVELWIEKTTQNDILIPLARRLGVNLVPGTGETSEILARAAVERGIEAGRPMRILYISDLDPGGRSMPVALARKIEFILRDSGLDLDITLEPILLLPEQCEQYRLPRTPIKPTERRAARFERRFGEGATELDALEALYPGEMAAIVEREVCRYIDPTLSGRCGRAFWELERMLQTVTAEVTEPYADELDRLNARYGEIQSVLQEAIDIAREALDNLEEEARPLWRQISDDLEEATPEIDPEDVPTARPPDPVTDPLFDSQRDYFEQLDSYRLWQRREEGD